ncbi:MAG: formyltransferase family protein [bacterium]
MTNKKKKLLVCNSGSGSGFEKLVLYQKHADYEVVGLIVDREDRYAIQRAIQLGITYTVMRPYSKSNPYTAEEYQSLVKKYQADFVALSGWLKPVVGLDPRTTMNIHPGPLPAFGGPGMYGHHVHEAVISAYKKGNITHSAVCMHFVTEEYDKGPVFARFPVEILPEYTADILGSVVNAVEHGIQAFVTNLVVTGQIYWDGKNPESLVLPNFIRTIHSLVV